MGMYTELVLKCQLKENLPVEVMDIIMFMFKGGNRCSPPATLPDHEFFKCGSWMMIGASSSFYHIPWKVNDLEENYLFSRSDLKNYGDEIEEFVDWLTPYIETGGQRTCIGWSWYEGAIEPRLLFTEPAHPLTAKYQ